MAEQLNIILVPHTHWDREWYQTFQQFRTRLVRTVDKLLDILDRDKQFSHFMLDGQTIVLDDYLEVQPEQEEHLKQYTRSGCILVGPWYVQPDEFLVSGESLIRNLQFGLQRAREFGNPMRVGYLPDSFGHIAQMPQILRGVGIDSAVFWQSPQFDMNSIRCNILALWILLKQLSEIVLWRKSVVGEDVLMLRINMGQQLICRFDDLWKPFLRFQVVGTVHKEQRVGGRLW